MGSYGDICSGYDVLLQDSGDTSDAHQMSVCWRRDDSEDWQTFTKLQRGVLPYRSDTGRGVVIGVTFEGFYSYT